MKLVHNTAHSIGNAYSIIVNKIPKPTFDKLTNTRDEQYSKQFTTSLLLDMPPTEHIRFLPKVEALEDMDNVVFSVPDDVMKWIEEAPLVNIATGSVSKIETDKYDAILDTLSQKLDEMKRDNVALHEAMEAQRKQYEQQLEASRKVQDQLQKDNQEAMRRMQEAMSHQGRDPRPVCTVQ
eukprot:TRINITY_DN1038_c1_g5_i1.p1 TRINITY_DN1038_c1_g5~~TRINITY_DN1038_c1_g5_i1.p1  ORF type:complete len:211 (-),score=67.20 TRINITY_DN1038_c1_g5_i1:76-615(-)